MIPESFIEELRTAIEAGNKKIAAFVDDQQKKDAAIGVLFLFLWNGRSMRDSRETSSELSSSSGISFQAL